ncbi:S-adenosyl-L-methionine-dependent methyltransferase [Crepidotus variabilis]|uniref:S-adenosyl-L-methionine-dependent methyltransferase n=1 Tax=Crepidotus variabilis TaxID=179855 RepID=A0A9P6EMB4_9AGAR|nr:S-adenosyl-L-methionine-dependent methyltransferase [Crepidotus variabilis]
MSTRTLPAKNEYYGTKAYWKRYSEEGLEESFDWFKSYSELAGLIHELIPDKSSKILMLGCGNSRLSEDMWEDGYRNITNVDYSNVVIEQMKQRHGVLRPEMDWQEMDVRNLTFEEGTFDVAIDKGTMDAMMTAKVDVWDPPQEVVNNCNQEVAETLRVLGPQGIFIYLTFGQPHFRRRYLQRQGTELEIKALGEAFHYYLYILRKRTL